jgi:hypothetical protein
MSRENNNGTAATLSELFDQAGTVPSLVALFVLINSLLWQTFQYFSSPLRKYPGPFLGGKS